MRRPSLLHFFPTPAFLSMPAVGFDISDKAIHFVELAQNSNGFTVKRFGKKEFQSENPDIALDQKLAAAVLEIAKEHKLKFVNASLPEEKAYLFKTEIPNVERPLVRSTIEFKLEEQVPIPPSEAVFDYDILKNTKTLEKGSEHMDVSVTVLPEIVVSSYVDLLAKANLAPLSFEIEPQALSRAVIQYDDEKTYLLVNFAASRTGLSIVSNGVVHFSSALTIGGNSLTTAIKKFLHTSTEEAEKIKKEHGFVKNKENMELFFSLMSTMSVLRDEMNRVLQYWKTREKHDQGKESLIDGIILCGEDVAIEGFQDYFNLSFHIPVTLGNVWANVAALQKYTPPIPFNESFAYAIAIGLALPKKK